MFAVCVRAAVYKGEATVGGRANATLAAFEAARGTLGTFRVAVVDMAPRAPTPRFYIEEGEHTTPLPASAGDWTFSGGRAALVVANAGEVSADVAFEVDTDAASTQAAGRARVLNYVAAVVAAVFAACAVAGTAACAAEERRRAKRAE